MTRAKFSHLPTDQRDLGGRILTLCGRRVDVMSLYCAPTLPFAPLCPKCAVAQLITDTRVIK